VDRALRAPFAGESGMTQSNKQEVRAQRPAQRAQGLDPEFTAQPRSIPDEVALEASAEPELSVDPDELGSRFLRDATEQGDFDPERSWPEESSLMEIPARDRSVESTNFSAGNSIWEQTVDLELRAQGAAEQLREPAPPAAADFDAAIRETLPDPIDVQDNSAHVLDNSIREFSLFDASDDDDDQAQDARSHRRALSEPTERDEQDRPTRVEQPQSGSRAGRFLRSALSRSGRALRGIADRLPHRRS
jgi:hypothetical protein